MPGPAAGRRTTGRPTRRCWSCWTAWPGGKLMRRWPRFRAWRSPSSPGSCRACCRSVRARPLSRGTCEPGRKGGQFCAAAHDSSPSGSSWDRGSRERFHGPAQNALHSCAADLRVPPTCPLLKTVKHPLNKPWALQATPCSLATACPSATWTCTRPRRSARRVRAGLQI